MSCKYSVSSTDTNSFCEKDESFYLKLCTSITSENIKKATDTPKFVDSVVGQKTVLLCLRQSIKSKRNTKRQL